MGTLLGVGGLVGVAVSLVLIIIKAIKKQPKKKAVIAIAICSVLFVVGLAMPSGDKTEESTQEKPVNEEQALERKTIYSEAEIVDLLNGFGTEKVGTMSVTKANQADCTEEALADWYFNYVEKNGDCNFHIIAYTDKPGKGVYATKGLIQKDISLTENGDGTYDYGNDAGATCYMTNEEEQTITVLYVMADESVIQNAVTQIDSVIPETYKGGKLYSVDVAGEEGKLDCDLILVNVDFATVDCQSIAVELATTVKELDLGIGRFRITFQSDDYTVNAVSSLDNLASQEASEVTTKAF